jgi:hypothetical protein
MALLSAEQQQHFRLAHGKMYLASCDGPCNLLIPASDLYVVKSWGPRKDKLLFLGAVPKEIFCMTCAKLERGELKMVDGLIQEPKAATVKVKVKKRDMIGPIRRAVLKLFEVEKPKSGLTTPEIVLRLYKRKSLRDEYGKGDIARTLSQMKKFRDLKKTDGKWTVRA